jgi:hypothetical protein
MAETETYLSIGEYLPEYGGYVAVLSKGSPVFGDECITILASSVVHDLDAAIQWRAKMLSEKPWEH